MHGRNEKAGERFCLSQSGEVGCCRLSATLTISTEVSHGFLGEG